MPQQEGLRSAICRSSFRQRAVGLMSGAWIWLLPSAYRLKISRAFIKCGSSKDFSDFFIKFLTDENDLVIDPFAGSNTTGYSAELLSRKWLSFELNSYYCEVSKVRFNIEPKLACR